MTGGNKGKTRRGDMILTEVVSKIQIILCNDLFGDIFFFQKIECEIMLHFVWDN